MNRARGRSVVRRSKGTEQCHYVVTRARIYHFLRATSVKPIVGAFGAFLALKLSRSERLWQGAGAVHSQHLSLHVDGARWISMVSVVQW